MIISFRDVGNFEIRIIGRDNNKREFGQEFLIGILGVISASCGKGVGGGGGECRF